MVPPPQRNLLPLLEKVKGAYVAWYSSYHTLPKPHRYSLGQRIDTTFVHIIEAVATAGFLPKADKLPYVHLAIRKVDTLKLLLMILWETKSLDTKKYLAVSVKIDEIGRMLGGWNGQLTKNIHSKQNFPD